MKSHIRAGQFNLRGKKSKLLSCRCCEVIDLRTEYMEKLADSEIEEFEERAAILEFDGKMSREGAQILALQLTLDKRQKRARSDPE